MTNDNQRKPNAIQHGVYSRTTILPGEDPEEFDELFSALIEEWAPVGATEEDAVLSLAKAIWRKRRAQKFIEIRVNKKALNPRDPSYDENYALPVYIEILRRAPDAAREHSKDILSPKTDELLARKFPPTSFKSNQEWAQAVITEIETVLLSRTIHGDASDAKTYSLCLVAEAFTDDVFDKELRLDERLDIMIDRAVKRLVQIKAMKQMLGLTSTARAEDPVRKIPGKRASG